MSKRNITFSKPEEPSFLRKLKEQIGYKEGPTVDTKRQNLDAAQAEDFEDTAEEQPTVVVLQPGDLTAEEADRIKQQLEKEQEETPADLSVPVVFKSRKPKPETSDEKSLKRKATSSSTSKEKPKKTKAPSLLSFDAEEEDN